MWASSSYLDTFCDKKLNFRAEEALVVRKLSHSRVSTHRSPFYLVGSLKVSSISLPFDSSSNVWRQLSCIPGAKPSASFNLSSYDIVPRLVTSWSLSWAVDGFSLPSLRWRWYSTCVMTTTGHYNRILFYMSDFYGSTYCMALGQLVKHWVSVSSLRGRIQRKRLAHNRCGTNVYIPTLPSGGQGFINQHL